MFGNARNLLLNKPHLMERDVTSSAAMFSSAANETVTFLKHFNRSTIIYAQVIITKLFHFFSLNYRKNSSEPVQMRLFKIV